MPPLPQAPLSIKLSISSSSSRFFRANSTSFSLRRCLDIRARYMLRSSYKLKHIHRNPQLLQHSTKAFSGDQVHHFPLCAAMLLRIFVLDNQHLLLCNSGLPTANELKTDHQPGPDWAGRAPNHLISPGLKQPAKLLLMLLCSFPLTHLKLAFHDI